MGRGHGSYIKKADREYLRKINFCFYCLRECKETHIEHIVALYNGGTSDSPNLTKCCKRCNSLKGTFSINEFLERITKKRDVILNKVYGYVHRLRRYRKKYKPYYDKDIAWLIDKIRTIRKEHSYFTSIITSLTNKLYFIYGY